VARPRLVNAARRAATAAIVSAGLIFPLVSVADLADLPPTVDVLVQGKLHVFQPGTTYLDAVLTLHLQPRAGNLVDVEGAVLAAARYPGKILLDGNTLTGDRRLVEGDRIWVTNGKDHTEPVLQSIVQVPGDRPSDPQFDLAVAPGEQVVTRGGISGKLVSSVFQPTGRAVIPKAVALTFDDGPWPGQTDRILQILSNHHVKATFFLVGYLAERSPDLVRAETAAGMTVGDHTWDHPLSPPFGLQPTDEARSQIARAEAALAGAGADPKLFRPPGGSYSASTVTVAEDLGMRVVLWSVDPRDWEPGVTKKRLVKRVLSNVKAGSIVIMHDGGGDRSATIAALPAIIKGIRAKGLSLVTIEP
jgi:peptidoglycan/xylan/chitin deacetylase (PgdA/CDA1 family)